MSVPLPFTSAAYFDLLQVLALIIAIIMLCQETLPENSSVALQKRMDAIRYGKASSLASVIHQ